MMTDTLARLRSGRLNFETMVDLDSAMKLKKGEQVDINEVIRDNTIYSDQKKGMRAGSAELENAFGTSEFPKIVDKIVKKGEIEVTQEFRDENLEAKRKQVVDFLVKNAVDARTGRPFTLDLLESSIKEAGISINNKPIETQISDIVGKLSSIIPIKIETKKIKINIPAIHTGKVYGLIQDFKVKEDWNDNGDLEVVINIPVGIQLEFYDKLNSITHGSAVTEEIGEK